MPEAFTTVLASIWTEVAAVAATITASALLLIPVGFMFARKTIGATKSLLGIGGSRRGR